jgi:hypothetical protein
MIEQRKNNFYRTPGTASTFRLQIDPVIRNVGSYCDELILNAKEIYDKKTGKLYCMYSGGIDSELVMEVFLSLGMDITPVIVNLIPDYNFHDMKWAYEYCNKRNLKPLIINIDLKRFIESGEILDVAHKAKTGFYQYLSTMKAELSLDGEVLTGQDEPYISPVDDLWYFVEKESWCGWANLYNEKHIQGTSCFLSWSAETLLAFMLDPTIEDLGNNRLYGKKGTFSSRKFVYGRKFPMPDRTKYTGWELVEETSLIKHDNILQVTELLNVYSGSVSIEYNQLVKTISLPVR